MKILGLTIALLISTTLLSQEVFKSNTVLNGFDVDGVSVYTGSIDKNVDIVFDDNYVYVMERQPITISIDSVDKVFLSDGSLSMLKIIGISESGKEYKVSVNYVNAGTSINFIAVISGKMSHIYNK